ncbi:ABC transporter ATP-binding protein [Nesterenkonia sp. F]|uniref:ABC transporter ATP-binding protein n=1 Tax=Nesterenkonia sp. F TaxID=795955 RepID=UPI000255D7A7|nr:ABC transporter ATP-binding protein [Nesterenkonia sp. F]
MAPVLQARELSKSYADTLQAAPALHGVGLTVLPGESVAIMGPSGSGKTTLMHVLSGILTPDAGEVQLAVGSDRGPVALSALDAEQRARLRREHIGFVFQEGLLLPELTALENVAVALMVSGVRRSTAEQQAAGWLGALGLSGWEQHRPGQLSGGQAQRVAIARAQAAEPAVVFADEPTGALDSTTSEAVLDALLDSTVGRGAPLVVVTHDETVAARCARIIRLQDGRLVADSADGADGAASATGERR